jgi:hypothetical protein
MRVAWRLYSLRSKSLSAIDKWLRPLPSSVASSPSVACWRGVVRNPPDPPDAVQPWPCNSVALNAAVEAAKDTGKSAAVIVTDWSAARWAGLAESER